ncbi:MAG: hypothetical protein IKN63_00645 [Bacilli bacterium]|nr:hypothetical protein [Bacilli bacterium]
MKNLNAEAFSNTNKRNKILLICGLILLVLTILLIYLGIENEKKPMPELTSLNNFISEGNNKENVYTYADINVKPYLFAVYETDGVEEEAKYYLGMDKENHLYILYMKEDKYNELNVDTIEDTPIRVTGLTKLISEDIKEIAIESYNELMEDEYLTKDNFIDYVGSVYLDMNSPINDSSLYYLGAFLLGFFGLLIITIYIVIIIKNKRTFKNIKEIELANIDAELSGMESSEYANMKFYLLKDYVVDMGNNVIILRYNDILWAYPYEQRYNGLLINKCIKLTDINNKKYDVASTKLLNKKKDEVLQEILQKLKEKNKDIIIGFNKENKKQVKEKIKENKREKNKIEKK